MAEDILQEAFTKGMNKVDALRSDESVVAWFYRVLRNALIDHRGAPRLPSAICPRSD